MNFYALRSPVFSRPATNAIIQPYCPSTIKTEQNYHSPICLSSSYSQGQQRTQQSETSVYNVNFKTLSGCGLGISRYPDFVYDAEGGLGTGTGRKKDASEDISVSFDIQTLYIPPLNSSTTRFLGLPLPPFLKIDIVPELFQGTIDKESGKVNLVFKAKFWFSVGSIYKAPPLIVETILTSEESAGKLRRGKGGRLDSQGKCRLVGVATVDPIDDFFMNSFLQLPTECLAELNAVINLSATSAVYY